MPRPLRIEYENAYYHVMNRGRAQQTIFHGRAFYEEFLKTLSEAHQRFRIEILCYCLMKNHYHLLMKTPEGNLGRVMRHINGVYTQRHNRLKRIDGALFRGRYKAICVEEDSYQLQLSRYIHRNPIEANRRLKIDAYEWSSYRYYAHTGEKPPKWLYQSDIFSQLGSKSRQKTKYRAYVELGVDEEMQELFAKKNRSPYLGSEQFRNWAYKQRITQDHAVSRRETAAFRPSMDEIVAQVANAFEVSPASIVHTSRGGTNNIPRWVAIYFSQELCGCLLTEIATHFGLKRTGSIPTTIGKLKQLLTSDERLTKRVKSLMQNNNPA